MYISCIGYESTSVQYNIRIQISITLDLQKKKKKKYNRKNITT